MRAWHVTSQHSSSGDGSRYLVRRSELARSVSDTEGFSVYDSIAAQIDWDEPRPWLALLGRLNDSQRAVVAVAQVHEHAAFNGVHETLAFHGPEVIRMAIRGSSALGCADIGRLLEAALARRPAWAELEDQWDRLASFEIENSIEANASDFFIAE